MIFIFDSQAFHLQLMKYIYLILNIILSFEKMKKKKREKRKGKETMGKVLCSSIDLYSMDDRVTPACIFPHTLRPRAQNLETKHGVPR